MTVSTSEVRAWAIANGVPVGTRGRLPADVKAAYAKKYPRRHIA